MERVLSRLKATAEASRRLGFRALSDAALRAAIGRVLPLEDGSAAFRREVLAACLRLDRGTVKADENDEWDGYECARALRPLRPLRPRTAAALPVPAAGAAPPPPLAHSPPAHHPSPFET
jgi:hypothetical protein